MIPTGNYEVVFYNRYGAKLRDLTTEQRCYTEARAFGVKVVRESEEPEDRLKPASYTVDRRLYNSLDVRQTEAEMI